MKNPLINYAFIDYQYVYLSVKSLNCTIDWSKFRVYLRREYNIENAYLFIEYIEDNSHLYEEFQRAGFICVFRHAIDETIKGDCDAEMVLKTMIHINDFDKAVIVTDNDLNCLFDYLISKDKFLCLLIPNKANNQALSKFNVFKPFIAFMNCNMQELI